MGGWTSTYGKHLDFLVQDWLVADLSRMVCPELLVGLENMLAYYQMVEGEMTGTRSTEMEKEVHIAQQPDCIHLLE